MSDRAEGRTARIATIKKLLIAFLILGIILPLILCILLFIKVGQLQHQINELSARRQNSEVVYDSGENGDNVETQLYSAAQSSVAEDVSYEELVISDEMKWRRKENQSASEQSGTKVYLTFDDGPSSNTDEILDILKQYDVKATFFVTGKPQEVYLPMYRRIVEEGHTLGMHSYSHRYGEIYASVEDFASDLDALQEFLYETTGVWSRFYRFPGGSSNQVSKVPMEELTTYLNEQDIYYLDWNVSCKDATGQNLRPQQIADNVTDHVEKYHTSVVLLHDASDKTSTVEALPLIIEELLGMEQVEILPVSDEMNMVQHLYMEENNNKDKR